MNDFLVTEHGRPLTTESGARLIVKRKVPRLHLLAENGKRLTTQSGLCLLAERDLTISAEFSAVNVELQGDGTVTVTWDGDFKNIDSFTILHSINGGSTWQEMGAVAGDQRSFSYTGGEGLTRVVANGTDGSSTSSPDTENADTEDEFVMPRYSIFELGETDEAGKPNGVNDRGEVLLTNTGYQNAKDGKLWSGGGAVIILEDRSRSRIIGPLQDGLVYYVIEGAPEYEYPDNWQLTKDKIYRWRPEQGGVEAGYGRTELFHDCKAEFDREDELSELAFIGEAERNQLQELYPGRVGIVTGGASLHCVNDQGNWVYGGGFDARSPGGGISDGDGKWIYYYCYFKALTGVAGGQSFNAAAVGDNPDEFKASRSGDRVVTLFQGTGGGLVCQRCVGPSPYEGDLTPHLLYDDDKTFKVYVNNGGALQEIPGATELCDLNSAAGVEGFVLGKAGTQAKLWAYYQGQLASVDLPGEISVNETGVVSRKISNTLLVPLGNQIWQGHLKKWQQRRQLEGKTYTTQEICGDPDNWQDINVTLVSPDYGLLVGTALKTKDANGEPLAEPEEHSVLLVPYELKTRDYDTGKDEISEGVVATANPTPEVELNLVSAKINGSGDLVIKVTGRVKDGLSEVLSSDRVGKLHFYVDGNVIGEDVNLQYTDAPETPLRLVDSETSFTRTLTIENPMPRGYVIKAETDANAAGNKAWGKVAVGIDIEHIQTGLPAAPNQICLAFQSMPGNSVADTLRVYVGDREPTVDDGTVTETATDSWEFTGTINIGNATADCVINIKPPGLQANRVDYLAAEVIYTLPNQSPQRVAGLWRETGTNTLRFYPDGFALGTVRQVVNCESNLPGSQVRTFEPLVMSKNVPDAWVTDANAKVKVNGVEHYLKKFTYTDREKYYVVADENSSHPKIFVPCEKDLPEEVSVNGADGENANIEWELVLGNSTHKIAETLVVAGDEPLVETFSTQAQPRSLSMQSATVPRSQTDRGWQQPGDAITMDDLLRAFNWIYPDDFSQLLLQVYQAEGHEIILTNVLGDYDFAYWKRPGTSKAAIKIEHNDNDVNPAIAAQYLWRGLNEALVCVADYRAAILAASPGNEMDVEVLQAWRSGVGAAAAGYALAATELYLAGISILNEGLDWALVINDVAEGHYTALVAALPFIPHGLIKAGQKSLRIRNTAGELLEEFATAEKLDAAKQLYRETDLRVMGVTMERENFSAFMRKALAHDGGPIKPPKSHGGLRRAMLKFSVPPSGKTIAHHDFPWLFKKDFADHGIDVNNPAFGRWIDHETHVNFHQRMNPKFNGFWREFFRNEIEAAASESVYTMKEIMEKLAEARAIYVIE